MRLRLVETSASSQVSDGVCCTRLPAFFCFPFVFFWVTKGASSSATAGVDATGVDGFGAVLRFRFFVFVFATDSDETCVAQLHFPRREEILEVLEEVAEIAQMPHLKKRKKPKNKVWKVKRAAEEKLSTEIAGPDNGSKVVSEVLNDKEYTGLINGAVGI
ncbi:uncharacterized protein PITG_07510 [Phytophthora infestans T30-4]|uniref:Uncharacterized protein n=1 Tax=Phytophthora infestans (strain T30-4) TaxID=403677 RepID=D0N8J1_PHYIT|nr:uncharacterized protein PITG_07510 [Phytophthora infestans T30-4]EEY53876.1 hypothetical protein PITG_07510 [Phytophthora infestans T30-4]|eukprot:XP_002904507.1 hypothetical protein PITG_07510 [Phytophthora infestans T30-4]